MMLDLAEAPYPAPPGMESILVELAKPVASV